MLVLEEIYRTKKVNIRVLSILECNVASAGGKNPFYFMMMSICNL